MPTQPAPNQQPTATPAGQPTIDTAAHQFLQDVESALADAQKPQTTPAITSYRDPTQTPAIGTATPVAQPGIPPQSAAAVDYAVRVLSTGVATGITSGGIALVLAASQVADPVVCGIVFGAPIGLAIPIAALSSLMKRTKAAAEAAPPVHHHHYTGTVDQRTLHNNNRGLMVKNTNVQQPR